MAGETEEKQKLAAQRETRTKPIENAGDMDQQGP